MATRVTVEFAPDANTRGGVLGLKACKDFVESLPDGAKVVCPVCNEVIGSALYSDGSEVRPLIHSIKVMRHGMCISCDRNKRAELTGEIVDELESLNVSSDRLERIKRILKGLE